MRKELSPGQRADLVKYRFECAHHMIEDAHTLLASNGYNSAMNRLYYACFYAAEGLLLANHVEAQTHNGVKM